MVCRSTLPPAETLHVGDLAIPVVRKRLRAVRLRVYAPGGEVKVSAPRAVSRDVIRRFIEAKLPWIHEQQQKMRNLPPERLWHPLDTATKRRFREQLLEQLPPLIARYEAALGVSVASFNLRHMKTRWGSCHPQRRHITFNLELAKHPLPQLEYVVAHELAHLRVVPHNQRFYALLDQVMPDWRDRRSALKDGLTLQEPGA